LVRTVIYGTLVVIGIGLFTTWVVASERRSFAQSDRRVAPSDVSTVRIDRVAAASSMDSDAAEATEIALDAARAAFTERRGFLDAGPAQLSRLRPGYTFVDGPSTTPKIVSIASTADAWAAAVKDLGGACHWIRATSAGDVDRGIGSVCTGAAAMSPAARR
jgi:hypothetical protein